MSRIGLLPVKLPEKVEVSISDDNEVVVKGPKGELKQKVNADIAVKVEDGEVTVERPTDQKRHKSMHGLYRSLISNMVTGVSEGYTKKLILSGIGFRAVARGQVLELSVGYSHPVMIALPPEVKVTAETVKGKDPEITLECIDKQLIGQVAAKIRAIRGPEPYKGKGIRYADEHIRRKAGKAAAAAAK
jgi:large subunit ribosomal protein L6